MTPRLEPTPTFFGPAERPLFGWVHHAPAEAAPLGLVVCNPFGYESICAHRSLRHFAQAAAAAGIPALRFDYDGTGDSAGCDRDPGRVAAWVASVRAAIDALRAATGVGKVCVLGFRLGAMLGALAAADRDDVSGFVAVAPVTSGRAYLRELRALQMAQPAAAPGASAVPADEREALGFPLTAETQAALNAVDLVRQDLRPAARVLLLDREDLPGADAWAARLRALGVAVDLKPVAGYAEAVAEPYKTVVPRAMIAQTIAWARGLVAPAAAGAPVAAAGSAPGVLHTAPEAPPVVETPAFLDADRRLFGILSAPAAENGAAPARRGILLVNAGSIHHIGPNRNYVALARRWAEKGHVVLRFDVSGIGDSAPHPGEDENVVYTRHADADVAQALAFLRRQPGVGKCVVIGLCSGAYNGFKAAVNGHQVDAIVSINPLTYFWKEGMSLDFAYPEHKVVDDARRYSTNMFRIASWMKLLRGGVNIRDAAQTVFRHGANVVSGRVRELARKLGVEFRDDLASELHRVARRGIRLHFVFAQDEPGLDLLYMQGGRSVERLVRSGKLHIDLIQAPGHTFTATWAQNALAAHLSAIVDAPAV